jgi:double zinc ribbon protein
VIAALVIGTLLAVGALAFVLYPIFFDVTKASPSPPVLDPAPMEGDSAVVALRELEFDRATGKLSEADYAELKTRYTRQAIAAMRREQDGDVAPTARPSDDEVEALVRAYRESRACPTCGPRPESDALYCSNCGHYLRDRCAACGAPVVAPDARYCTGCGNRLAA